MAEEQRLTISTGQSRRATLWKQEEILWHELVEKLGQVQRTGETVAQWQAMPKAERDNLKDVGGFVGGMLHEGRRNAKGVISRCLLTLDLDSVPPQVDPWQTVTLVLDCSGVLYSTHSHQVESPRYRLVMPLSRAVSPEEYEALSRMVASDIGMDFCDDTTYEPHRLMYWPSASQDAPFRYEVHQGEWLCVEEYLGRYEQWQDPLLWPRSSRKAKEVQRLAKKQGDPLAKTGIVGAFCRVYSVEQALETFLAEQYTTCGMGRYSYAEGSTVGGLVLYEEGRFAYSHHSTDPISGKLCNAFDLVRIHLFGADDEGIAPNTKAQNYPSFQFMTKLAQEDTAVASELKSEQLEEIIEMFQEIPQKAENCTDWLQDLEMNPKTGKPTNTIHNIFLILTHDPRMIDRFYYDEFRGRAMVCGDLPWITYQERSTKEWEDNDDAGLRWELEKTYKIDHVSKVKDGIDMAMQKKNVTLCESI